MSLLRLSRLDDSTWRGGPHVDYLIFSATKETLVMHRCNATRCVAEVSLEARQLLPGGEIVDMHS